MGVMIIHVPPNWLKYLCTGLSLLFSTNPGSIKAVMEMLWLLQHWPGRNYLAVTVASKQYMALKVASSRWTEEIFLKSEVFLLKGWPSCFNSAKLTLLWFTLAENFTLCIKLHKLLWILQTTVNPFLPKDELMIPHFSCEGYDDLTRTEDASFCS